MGRILNTKPRTPGRHTPEAISATTIPNQRQDEAPVISLRSDETLETLWTSALDNHDGAVQAKQAADRSQKASDAAAADASRLHEEGMKMRAQAEAKLLEAEQIATAAQTDKKRADDASTAHKRLQAITADLTSLVDSLHAKAATGNPELLHPRQRRPIPAAPGQDLDPKDIDPSDPFATQRHGPVTDTTAEFPPVPSSPNGPAAAFRKDVA